MISKKLANGLGILAALFLIIGFYHAEAAAKEKFEEKFEETVKLANDGGVVLSNVSGNIEVKSWNKGEVKIDALKVAKASTLSKAKENAQKVKIEVNKEGKTLRIKTRYPKIRKSLNVSVSYRLWIPDKASVDITSVSGNVDLEKIGGKVKTDVTSGNVDVRKADKGVDCETVSGNLELQDIAGDAFLKTTSGEIIVHRIKGSIDAEVTSGRIELREVSEAKVVKGETLSGTIIYEGKINPDGRYTLDVHSGNIKMILPSDSGFEFTAKTFSGNIKSDFEVTLSGKLSKKELRGVVNKGGAVVKLSTFSGNIYLGKR